MKRLCAGLILVLLMSTLSYAQSKGGMVKGVLVDAQTHAPVDFASVTLHNPKDSTAIKGCASGKTGEFILPGIPAGKYFLKISYLGYEKKFISNIGITSDKTEISLGQIELTQSAVNIAGTEVVGQKAEVEYHVDKKVINVSQNLSSSSGSVLDILKTQPSVQVDQNENVTLRGSSSFTVLIDGRPNPIQGNDALRQIPANIVENIEIITNPSAKYEAEGAAGIINIITKRTAEGSYSGMVNTGAGTRDKYNGDFTLNYREKSFAVSAGVDFLKQYNFFDQTLERETFAVGQTIFNNTLLDGSVLRDNLTGRIGFDYNFNEKTGITLNTSFGKMDVGRKIYSDMHNYSTLTNSYSVTDDIMNAEAKFFSGAFYFTHKFNPKVNELSFEASYNNVKSPSTQTTGEYLSNAAYDLRMPNPSLRDFFDDTKRSDGRIKLNYSHTFSPKSKLETGVQMNYYVRNFDTRNKIFDWDSNTWVVTANYTNQFDYRNNIYAAFATYSNELWDLSFQLGLRTEYTDRLLQPKSMISDFRFEKLDFFPTFNIQKKLSMAQTLQFSFSRRINRPNELLLNPYPLLSTSYTSSSGNPYLKPEYINSFELNYQNFFSGIFLTVETFLRLSNDTPSQAIKVDELGRMNTTFENFAKTTTWGSDITASYSPLTWLTIRPSLNLSSINFSGSLLGSEINNDAFNWRAMLFSTFSISSNTSAQLIVVYLKITQPLFDIKPITFLIATVRQQLFDKKLTIALSAQNLFNLGKINITNSTVNYRNAFIVNQESNIINLTLTYNFNNFKDLAHQAEKVDIGVSQGIQ